MQKFWLRKNASENLLIFALGWASSPGDVAHVSAPAHDVLCVFDYRELEPLSPEEFCDYKKIILVAWSFGVWAAERVAARLPLARAIAFNGTPAPVNDKFGMRPRLVALTIRGLEHAGMDAFNGKTFGGENRVPERKFGDRTLAEKIAELSVLAEKAQEDSSEKIAWSKAFVSPRDEIFPPAAAFAYWRARGIEPEEIDTPHYPFANPEILLREIAE